MPIVEVIQGDIVKRGLRGDFAMVVQGCNCFNTMGSGLAPQMKKAWPELEEVDNATEKGDKDKLGKLTYIYDQEEGFYIINAYTQYAYGKLRAGEEHKVDYKAVEDAFYLIDYMYRNTSDFPRIEGKVAIPKIGAGLAKGHWKAIETIINLVTPNTPIVLVEYKEEEL